MIDAVLFRYLIVGLLNTLLGFGLVLLLQEVAGMPPLTANAVGYAAGLVCSYMLNRRFTFRSRRRHREALPSFAVAALVSYLLNVVALEVSLQILQLPAVIAQACAAVTFTGSFYILSRLIVFRPDSRKGETN